MFALVKRYTRWLHTRWPAGTVEKLPEVRDDYSTNVAGVYVTGDLTGIPLLKFSTDSGARAVQTIVADKSFQKQRGRGEGVHELVIIGGGVSGMSAALEARRHDLNFVILEATEPFSTIVNFPKGKPIYTYPTEMVPAGELRVSADVKEPLVDELRAQTIEAGIEPRQARATAVIRERDEFEIELAEGAPLRARRVIVAIGRSGNFRKLNVPGEERDKVYNRLHDPADFCGSNALVVGGGDSALETAIALGKCGARVTLSYRKPEFSRPKPENVDQLHQLARDPEADVSVEQPSSERVGTATGAYLAQPPEPGSVTLALATEVQEIGDDYAVLTDRDGREQRIDNDVVFSMIGREPPLDFFRRSRIKLRGEMRWASWLLLALFVGFCFWVYNWKDGILPGPPLDTFKALGDNPATLLGTLAISAAGVAFWYTLVYSALVVIFGVLRIRRRKTPYITWQTGVLMAIQVLPLFILPEIILPWLGHNGAFDAGAGKTVADALFPEANYGHGREYWRAYGFILAWPLMAWNWFTDSPLYAWLVIGFLQTFVLIPWMIYYWGKGAYCGWICSCGAMAETLGDQFRHKMPHGPGWNRLNMLGQGILAVALVLMALRITGWVLGDGSWADNVFKASASGVPFANYRWIVDLLLAGVLGYGLYFWFSGRMWCRFACPLAALMHIYARFSRFRILADKKKCISCNVCTSVCHQGIDVMNFANKGLPMADPQCVRCSACVQSCPTGVLSFGQVNRKTEAELCRDKLPASPVQMAERGER